MDTRRGFGGVLGLWALGVLIGAGCERLPWESPSASVQQGATSSESPASLQPALSSVPPHEVVAKVNGTAVSTTDVELATIEVKRFVQATGQGWQSLPTTEAPGALDLVDMMHNLTDTELKAQDARARGLDQKLEVRQRLTYVQRGFYAQEWDRWQRERALPTEEQIHQFYEQNRAGFMDPERIRVRQIVTESLSEAEAVRTKTIQGGMDMAQLARDFSVGAGKEQDGDIGWHLRTLDRDRLRLIGALPTEEVFFPQLEPVAFALESGQVSQPVKGPDGRYYVVRLEERKPARQQTELEVHDAIRELLTIQNMQRQLDQLRAGAQIEQFPERLEAVKQ